MKNLITALLTISFSTILYATPLTTGKASNWLDAMEAMQKWGETHASEIEAIQRVHVGSNRNRNNPNGMPSFTEAVNTAKAMGFYDEVSALVSNYGFSDLYNWAEIGDKVIKAFMAHSMQGINFDPKMQQQLAAMENNPSLTAEQKAMLRQSMAQMQQMVSANSNAPAADIEAIKPLIPRLQAMGQK